MLRRPTFLVCLVLFIAACGGRGNLTLDPEVQLLWTEQQAAAGAFNQWDMYARAVLRPHEGGVYSVGLRWQREADGRFMMMLDAPFGQGVLRIEALKAGVYRLRLPNGRSFENSTAEALLEDAIGWSLPVSGLDYWVRGLPHALTEYSYRLDAGGRARSIKQDGWEIEYLEYSTAAADPALPRRLRLGNDELSFKLVIERWWPAAADATDSELFPSFD